MNKTVTIILIVLLSLVAIVASLFLGFMIKGGYNINILTFNIDNSYSENLLDKQEFIDVEEINIKSDVADIFIEESTDKKITIELYSEEAEEHFIKEENGTVEAKLKNKHKIRFGLLKKNSKIIVKIPKDYDKKIFVESETSDVKLDSFENLSLDIAVTTGDLEAKDLKKLKSSATTGDVKVNNIKEASISVTTGDIEINTIDSIDITTTTGDVKINQINNKIKSEQNTGSIRLGTVVVNEDSSIKTTTGDVRINTLTNAYINANTKTGDLRINNNDRTLENEIVITTTTGDIRVN